MRLSLHLGAADPAGLRARAELVGAEPLSRRALAELVAPTPGVREALRRWFADAGLTPTASGLGDLDWSVALDRRGLVRLFGEAGAALLLTRRRLSDAAARTLLPTGLDAGLRRSLVAMEVDPGEVDPRQAGWRLEPPASPSPLREPVGGLTPIAVARGYGFDDRHDGDGETVAMMALGGLPAADDIHGFARAFGLPAPQVEIRPLTTLGACADDGNCRFETTMGLQWLCALAPGVRVIVYVIDPGRVADPWATFLAAVLADDAQSSIAVTSWSAPARQYYAVHGHEHIAGLLDQAAVVGVTVIAASGDWGAYDGFPSAGPERRWCDDLGPHDTFPGAEPRVLSVGGTQVIALEPWREVAWSAPVSASLRAAIGLGALAGSGGVSRHHPLPAYQRAVAPDRFERSAGAPAIPATGRIQPDVSLMAWGPDAGTPGSLRPTAYAALIDGCFRDDAGGTSVAAPIWAGICARLNQARRRQGAPRLGWLQPHLYAAYAAHDHALMRTVDQGCTDIALPVDGGDGQTSWRCLPGFLATAGLDPATGLGVPRVDPPTRALATQTSP